MRRPLVQKGLFWLSGSILVIALVTFYFPELSRLFDLDRRSASLVLFWSFFAAGTVGCTSIIVIINGVLKSPVAMRRPSILPALILFILSVVLFCYLLLNSFHAPSPSPLRPGETITI
jgi:hypothetical protein